MTTEPLRDADVSKLHPAFRKIAQEVLDKLAVEGISFRLFEGFRSRERQAWLWAAGRTRLQDAKGNKIHIVTKAQPGQSFHQYGLAGDFVLYEDGKWNWAAADREHAEKWRRLQEVGVEHYLTPLSFEMPHLQYPAHLADLQLGTFPPGGDASWQAAINGDRVA